MDVYKRKVPDYSKYTYCFVDDENRVYYCDFEHFDEVNEAMFVEHRIGPSWIHVSKNQDYFLVSSEKSVVDCIIALKNKFPEDFI